MAKKLIIIILFILVAAAALGYWFLFRTHLAASPTSTYSSNGTGGGSFTPFGANGSGTNGNSGTVSNPPQNGNSPSVAVIPILRHISLFPIGGMVASSTPSTTVIRYVDRGSGHIYETTSDTLNTQEISNTTVPQIYETYWNGNASAFIFRALRPDSDIITNFYAELRPIAISSSTSALTGSGTSTQLITTVPMTTSTAYELRGQNMSSNIIGIAVSPTKSSVFTLDNESGHAVGYTVQFNGSQKTQVFSSPATDFNVEWPAPNTIALTTKGLSTSYGFLYFINPKSANLTKILGKIYGLSTLVSKDASQVLYSASNGNSITTSIYNVKSGAITQLAFNTMPEKCVWSTLRTNELYCAVPGNIPQGNYPEDWYQGKVAFTDNLWEVDTTNNETHFLGNLSQLAAPGNGNIDAINLTLDPRENYLYFVNKNDLTLWSFNLNG